jgi:hypothetical protein
MLAGSLDALMSGLFSTPPLSGAPGRETWDELPGYLIYNGASQLDMEKGTDVKVFDVNLCFFLLDCHLRRFWAERIIRPSPITTTCIMFLKRFIEPTFASGRTSSANVL